MKNSFPISGVGSLPFSTVEEATQYARKMDLIYVPQLPRMDKWELMIPQTLHGLGGLKIWDDGAVSLEDDTELTLPYLPSENYLCWNSIISRPSNQIKIQVTGVGTLLKYVGGAGSFAKLIQDTVLIKTKIMIEQLNKRGSFVIVSFDEPAGIHQSTLELYTDLFKLQQTHNCAIGFHCCSDTDWNLVLQSPCSFISFDADLSNESLFINRDSLISYFERGGILAPGVVPTLHFDRFDPELAIRDLWNKLSMTLSLEHLVQYSSKIVLTAACGHAFRPIEETLETIDALRDAQLKMRLNLTKAQESCGSIAGRENAPK